MSTGRSSIEGSIRIMIVDDHPLLRQGISALIRTQPDMELVAEACDGEEAIAQFRLHRPDVTLMDLQMPNVNGTEAISRIKSEFPDAAIQAVEATSIDRQAITLWWKARIATLKAAHEFAEEAEGLLPEQREVQTHH